MRPRKKRTDEEKLFEEKLFEEKQVALAAGGSSGGSGRGSGGRGFVPGENLPCKVICEEPGGYTVHVGKEKLIGFLPTQEVLEIEASVMANFVCLHNGRMLMSARFSTRAE